MTETRELAIGDVVRKGNGKIDYVVVAFSDYDFVDRSGTRRQGTQVQIKKVGTKNTNTRGGWHSPGELRLLGV